MVIYSNCSLFVFIQDVFCQLHDPAVLTSWDIFNCELGSSYNTIITLPQYLSLSFLAIISHARSRII